MTSAAPPFELSIKTDLRPGPGTADSGRHYAEVLTEVAHADRLGYRTIWTTEHHGVDDGYLGAQFPALAAFAAVTAGLRLGTGVLLLPHYNWRQVLESAVVVDAFSGGRLEIGIGAGSNSIEFHIFGVDRRRRGRLLEEGTGFLRRGLDEGVLPDGPDGALVPLSPRPVQARVPILFGGWAPAAIDRAVRLGDGYLGTDAAHAEANIPAHYRTVLAPALAAHGRTLADFRYVVTAPIWVTDDPERDWRGDFGEAFRYQQRRYIDALDDPSRELGGSSVDFDPGRVMIGTPGEVARRLTAMRAQAPWDEFSFYYRLPGISHDRAMDQLERVATQLRPLLATAATA